MGILLFNGRIAYLGSALGLCCLPIAAFGIYERLNPLTPPLNVSFPLTARYYVRRALWSGPLEQKAYYLDKAMQRVLSAGLGAASPQSTALVVYLSQLYLEERPPQLEHLRASYVALSHKPHIGEGVAEERSRLEMSFRVADKLMEILKPIDLHAAREYAASSLMKIEKAPPFLGPTIKNHPLADKFRTFLRDTQ